MGGAVPLTAPVLHVPAGCTVGACRPRSSPSTPPMALQRRQARLERLNAQLRDFYGPLYAIFQANHIAHLRFVDTLRPGSSTLFAPDVAPPNDEELRLWRLWAERAHRHRSTPADEPIINKAHLLIEDEMPECLLRFCAHRAGYDVLIERWKQGDDRDHLSVVRHPGAELHDDLQQSFTRLKREQARELAPTQGRAGEKLVGRWPGLPAM